MKLENNKNEGRIECTVNKTMVHGARKPNIGKRNNGEAVGALEL